MKKKIGIVGFGEMGKRHGLEFREATQGLIEIAGVVEPSDEMYRRGCEWNHIEVPRYGNIREMLRGGQLDGVLITSPNNMHLLNLLEFAGQTIPILLEKPLDTKPEVVAEIVRFASRYEGIIVVDHVMRYAPVIRRARQIVESGRLGKLASFQFTQRIGSSPFNTFRRTFEGGGGQIIEKATHDLDVILYLFDTLPDKVAMVSRQQVIGGNKPNDLRCSVCEERLRCPEAYHSDNIRTGIKDISLENDLCVYAQEVDVPDNETCLIEMTDGTFGTYSHTYFCEMRGHSRIYEVIGTEGSMSLQLSAEDPGYRGILRVFPRNGGGEVETYDYDYNGKIHYNGGPYVARHFYNLMTGAETEAFTTVNQAFVAETLGFAAIRAAREGRFVPVASLVPEDLLAAYSATYRGAREVPRVLPADPVALVEAVCG